MGVIRAFAFPFINKLTTGVIDNVCAVFNDALQYVKIISSGLWQDETKNGNDLELVESNVFKANGTDNLINATTSMRALIENDTEGTIEFDISYTTTDLQYIFSVTQTSSRLFGVRIQGGKIKILNSINGTNIIETDDTFNDGFFHKIIVGTDTGAYTISVDGVNQPVTAVTGTNTSVWFNDIIINHIRILNVYTTSEVLFFGELISSLVVDGINIPFQLGAGNKAYNINALYPNNELTIEGTVDATNWVKATIPNDYNVEKGFSVNGDSKIPASQVVGQEGKDALGNDLTNPAIYKNSKLIGFNGGCKVQQKNLGLYDDDDFWYSGGVRIAKEITDFANCPDYVSANIVEAGKDVRGIATFDHTITIEEQLKINKCYAKVLTNVVTDEGEIVTDDNQIVTDN